MKLFRQTEIRAFLYACIFTGFPYLIAFILIAPQHDTSGWGEGLFRIIVQVGNPLLWPFSSVLPLSDDLIFFCIYPLLSFIAWFILVYTSIYIIRKLKERFKTKSKS